MPEYSIDRLNMVPEAHRTVEPILSAGERDFFKKLGDRPCDTEADPDGLDAHTPGAKLDAGKPRMSLVIDGFPRALLAVGVVATAGAAKYSDHGWLSVKDGFARYTDALNRHILDESIDGEIDPETGLNHAAQVAWNALARLEILLRKNK